MGDPPIISVWRAIFHCGYGVVVDALRHFMVRLRRRDPRPLAFGFTEAGDGSTHLDFQETQRDDGTFFVIKLINWNHKSQQPHEENVGVMLIYKGRPDKTQLELRCPLEKNGSQIDYVVEIAKHFASEARGHSVAVESDVLPTDFVRDFAISATITEMSRAFAIFNDELKTFGYWIDLPEEISQDMHTGAYIILKTDGANPYFSMKPFSPFWRHEVGAIEYLQIKNKTRLKIFAVSFEERDHLWSYVNILKQKMHDLDMVEETQSSPISLTALETCIDDFVAYIAAERRLTFWQSNQMTKKHKWISRPEEHAKNLLATFLNGRFGNTLYTFEEIKSGAGKIDVFIVTPRGEKAIIELKMCGNGYSEGYAQGGIEQLSHYMRNKNTKIGYLVVFDSRIRDFSKGFQASQIAEGMLFITKVVDVRPIVKIKPSKLEK